MGYKKLIPYLIPSIGDILFAILLIVLFITGTTPLGDGDTGYHIRTGQLILDTLTIPKTDPFSFIKPALPWTAHEWLSEVIMALIHYQLGLTGVVLLFVLIIAITYTYLYRILRAENGNLWLLLGIFILVITTSSIHWLARPHIFSLLFFVIWYHLLDKYQYENKNYLYALPPMILLWANLHGGFIIGLILLGIYFTGNAIYWLNRKDEDRSFYFKKCKVIALIGLASVFMAIINPYGFHILLFPFRLVGDNFIMSIINEFMPTNAQKAHFYIVYLLLTLSVLTITKKRLNVIELILIIFFIYMSLYSVRYITLFSIIVAPIVLKRLDASFRESNHKIIRFLNRKSESIAETDAQAKGVLWPSLAVIAALIFATTGFVKHTFDPEKKPVQAVEFLQKEHVPGHMFNNDEFGDYLIYTAFPEYRVFIDGRSDMYGTKHCKDYLSVRSLGANWGDILNRYKIQWVFFDADSLLSRCLSQRTDWHLIYADKVAHIYVKDIPEYKCLIEKYKNVEPVIDSVKKL